MDIIIPILSVIDSNLSDILRRVPITRYIYARTDVELKNCYLEHILDIIEVIRDDEILIDELVRNISRNSFNTPRIRMIQLKESLKRFIREIEIEIVDNDETYQNEGIMTNILVINEYSIYFNDRNNMEMTNDNEIEQDNVLSHLECYQNHTSMVNLFNVHDLERYLLQVRFNFDERQILIRECVNNTIKFIFFELFYEYLTKNIEYFTPFGCYSYPQRPLLVYGLMF